MSTARQSVRLDEVLKRSTETAVIQPEAEYQEITVRLWGKGVVPRGAISGAQLVGQRRFVARAGQFILSRIDARHGASGLVPPFLNGALVSSDFPVFSINTDRLHPAYLEWLSRTGAFVAMCRAASEGTTNRVRLSEASFLALQLELPPLPEQQQLVSWIESIAREVRKAQAVQEQTTADAGTLLGAYADGVFDEASEYGGLIVVGDACISVTDGDHNTPPFEETGIPFIFVGNVSSGRLHFAGAKHVNIAYFANLKSHRVPARGDILYSAVGATLGIPVVVDTDLPFCFQRHIAILKPDRRRMLPRFLWHMLRSRTVTARAWQQTTGSAQPTIPLRAIRALPIPLPPVPYQQEAVARLDQLALVVSELRQAQHESVAKISRLLPALLDQAFAGRGETQTDC